MFLFDETRARPQRQAVNGHGVRGAQPPTPRQNRPDDPADFAVWAKCSGQRHYLDQKKLRNFNTFTNLARLGPVFADLFTGIPPTRVRATVRETTLWNN